MDNIIESKDNRIVKDAKSLLNKKNRDETSLFIADGLRFVKEIPNTTDITRFIFSKSFAEKNDISLYMKRAETYIVTDRLFKEISDTKNPQGIIAICKKKSHTPSEVIKKGGFYIICEEINDPGNLGTVIRTAHAAGADGIFLTKNSVDLYNSKVLRSTMGSIFKIPIVQDTDISEIADLLKNNGIKLFAAHLNGTKKHFDVDYSNGCCFVLGNEARGMSDYAADLCDELILIPMPGGAESLNASVAAAVLMYECVRQRLIQ